MQFFRNFWKKISRQTILPKAKHITKYAFTCGGIDYYAFDDIFNLPYKRALQAVMYYTEVRMNCNRDYLQAHVDATRNLLNPTAAKPTIELHKVNALNEQLAQRLSLPPDTELLYKLASVVYFDKNENPEVYEFGYGARKIAHWKQHATVKDFFLQKPIVEFLPFLNDLAENLDTFHGMMADVNKYHLANLFPELSEEQKNQFESKNNSSSAATPQS